MMMDSEDGENFVKQLAIFVRTHEKALANALQFQRRDVRHRPSRSTSAASIPSSPKVPERPATSSATGSLAATFSLGSLNFASHSVKSAKLALTPHHLFYLLSRFEELGINVGPMKVRLENLHDSSSSNNYVSFLGNTGRLSRRGSDVGSIHSVSSVRSVMSGMSALWNSFGIGASISAARTERQKAAVHADLKYLYSAFTKIPCLRLAPDWRARLIRGYEEFPFDSAVPIFVFKNLQALEITNIDFRQFFGWDRLADQLRSLNLKQAGIEDPADILIDIVLDDMDKRRRRTSKSHPSPTATWATNNSPRRSPSIPVPELVRAASAPGSPEHRSLIADLRRGLAIPSEPAVDDSDASDAGARPSLTRENTDENPGSPGKANRTRSISPSRPANTRHQSAYARPSQQRLRRSGSGSSHSSLSESRYHHNRGSSGSLLAMGPLPPSKWRFLRHLSLADNAMTSIPSTSLYPLANTLYSLDLSSNLFSQVPESLATLTALRALNLSCCMIDSLNSLKRNPLPAITALNLRANRLQSLAGIEKLFPLERLDLRDNQLVDPLELARLTGIPEIREVWLDGNPFTKTHKHYRITIFNLFRAAPGYTEDIIIDGSGPTYSERRFLVERAPVPESVPVVKAANAEPPQQVEGTDPSPDQGSTMESSMLRQERPIPAAVASNTNTSSSRRRKVSKRRIVDLATNSSSSPVSFNPAANNETGAAVSFGTPEMSPKQTLLPSAVLENGRSSEGSFAMDSVSSSGQFQSNAAVSKPEQQKHRARPVESDKTKQSHDWSANGELYRQRIEELRDKVGNGYLSALTEESWDGGGTLNPAAVSSIAALHAEHAHRVPHAQPVHSGRVLR